MLETRDIFTITRKFQKSAVDLRKWDKMSAFLYRDLQLCEEEMGDDALKESRKKSLIKVDHFLRNLQSVILILIKISVLLQDLTANTQNED